LKKDEEHPDLGFWTEFEVGAEAHHYSIQMKVQSKPGGAQQQFGHQKQEKYFLTGTDDQDTF
jgi:hypothetical protein